MTRPTRWLTVVAALVVSHGCGRPPGVGVPASEEAAAGQVPGEGAAARETPADTPAQGSAAQPGKSIPEGLAPVPLRDVAAGAVEAGRSIRVRGTCIGYARVVAAGPQPRTRSDWQLVDDDVALWVVGPYPDGCSGTIPSDAPGTYTMVVAADTLPALGGGPPRPRLYLVHTPAG
jgi:hypothetical protein